MALHPDFIMDTTERCIPLSTAHPQPITMAAIADHADLGVIIAAIAHSPIIVARHGAPLRQLPAGFDQVDAGILLWIAAEGRRIGRVFIRH